MHYDISINIFIICLSYIDLILRDFNPLMLLKALTEEEMF